MDSNILNRIFIKHPEEQNMTYVEHLKHACFYGIQTLGCSIVFMIHGFIPCLFEKTGSTMIQNLHDQLNGINGIKTEKEKLN